MSEDPSPRPTPESLPALPAEEARSPEGIDVGCMIGLALILILMPVSLYVAAPLTVLGIVAAVLAWGLMRITPQKWRDAIGYGRVWLVWFILLILVEAAVGFWIKYENHHGGEMRQRM